jgi:hypothetical protein
VKAYSETEKEKKTLHRMPSYYTVPYLVKHFSQLHPISRYIVHIIYVGTCKSLRRVNIVHDGTARKINEGARRFFRLLKLE